MTTIYKKLKIIFLTIIFICFFGKSLFAFSLIRDAEIEDFLYDLSNPLIKAAGLNPQKVKIYIINDNQINAFVTGGQNIFVNTGLITKYKTPDALIGVIAHEIGHIKAGHIVRFNEGLDDSRRALMLSYLLGAGAMVAGSYDAGSALLMGGAHIAGRMQQKYTREQEEAADQYALKYLETISYPADGLIELLQHFKSEFQPYSDMIDEYALSHPISQKRIDLIKDRTKERNFTNKVINSDFQPRMNIVLAKLEGFMENPELILEKYQNQNSKISNYIKAIAFHRQGLTQEALKILDNLIATQVVESDKIFNIGFLYELKGQFLFESGDAKESLIVYDKAIDNLPSDNANLVKIAFATAINSLQINDEELLNLTLDYLIQAKIYENDNPSLHMNLAKIYDKLNDEADSFLALAHYNLLINNDEKAKKYAKKAQKIFEKDKDIKTDKLIEVEDILKTIEDKKE